MLDGAGGGATARRIAEKADALASTQSLSLAINTALAGSAAAILFSKSPTVVVLWLVAALTINGMRWAALCSRHLRKALSITPRRRLRLATGGSLIAGVIWGVLPATLMDFRTAEAPFLSIILCGLTAGAALQGGAFALPAIALAVPILGPLGVRSALLGTTSGYLLSFDIVLYLAMIIRSSRAAEASFDRLLALRWHASSMALDLKQRHEDALASADQLFRMANHDPLTGTANRAAFTARLQAWLEQAYQRGASLTLLLLDLDHFKAVNDTLGHGAGDAVLTVIAKRLETFAGADRFVARLGGDEFAVLLADCCDEPSQREIADSIIREVSAPLQVRGITVALGASLGLARYPSDALTAEDLLARADLALYAAKDAGRRAWRSFEPKLLSAVERARDIERDLPAAFADGSLQIWFQPQVEVLSGRLIGLEALIRWQHPQLGWVSPPEVVTAAFNLRESEDLTRMVLDRACEAAAWLAAAGFERGQVAVNISPRELDRFDLLAAVTEALKRHAVEPASLEIEITEEAVLSNDEAIGTLAVLRELGVRLAMDDFGTGNSAIAYLRKLTMDRLKIDREFIRDITTSEGDRALVKAIISMGRSLGVEVLAEGVETHEQAMLLRSLGCHLAQGYLYGAAAPLSELEQLKAAVSL